ncbi:MAG: PH domain-containing protein [Gaiellaceae bacterium]
MRGYLEPGEKVRFEARPHTAALVRPLGRSVILALAGGVLVGLSPAALGAVGALLLGVGALLALGAVWRWDRTSLVVTNDKLFVVYGIAQRRAAAVRLAKVGPVEVEQGPLGRMLGYGTVIAGDLEIPYVPDPRRVCRLAG